jgi:N-acetylgalactosamine-6-sulfatase
VEYRETITVIGRVHEDHKSTLVYAKPELDWCDLAVQNWSPAGCETLNRCMPAPMSRPYRCNWPY